MFSFTIDLTVEEGERRVREDPESPYSHAFLGGAHFLKRNWAQAEKAHRRADELLAEFWRNPDECRIPDGFLTTRQMAFAVSWELAESLSAQGKFDDACLFFTKALRLNDCRAELWNNYGSALGKLGKRNEALKAYRLAVSYGPLEQLSWQNLRSAYSTMTRFSEVAVCDTVFGNVRAVERWQRFTKTVSVRTERRTEQYLLAIARLFFFAHDWYNMERVVKQLLEPNRNDIGALVLLAELELQYHARYKAIDILHNALAIDKNAIAAWWSLSRAYLGEGNATEAETALRKTLELNPSHEDARLLLDNIEKMKAVMFRGMQSYRIAWSVRGERDTCELLWELGATVSDLLGQLKTYWGTVIQEGERVICEAKNQDLEPGDFTAGVSLPRNGRIPTGAVTLSLDRVVLPGEVLVLAENSQLSAAARVMDTMSRYGL